MPGEKQQRSLNLHKPGLTGLQRRLTEDEYEALIDFAIENGIENGFIQDQETAQESFIPAFDGEGI